jgi:hypothetical protein
MPPDAQNIALTIDRTTQSASAQFTVPAAGTAQQVLLQVAYTTGNGKYVRAVPRPFTIPTRPGRLEAFAELNADLERKALKSLSKLGPLIDPEKDCQLIRTDKSVQILVPGKLHTLSPQISDRKNKPVLNAPMSLAQVAEDFLIHVRVAGEIHPGADPVIDPWTRRPMKITYQGAGIVLWKDKRNFIRLERCCGTAGRPTLVTRILIEVYKDGREVGRPYYLNVPEGPMSVMMVRKEGRIRCLFSQDGRRWAALREIAAEFPGPLSVGLLAVNMSTKPLTAQFEDFVLVEGKDEVGSLHAN